MRLSKLRKVSWLLDQQERAKLLFSKWQFQSPNTYIKQNLARNKDHFWGKRPWRWTYPLQKNLTATKSFLKQTIRFLETNFYRLKKKLTFFKRLKFSKIYCHRELIQNQWKWAHFLERIISKTVNGLTDVLLECLKMQLFRSLDHFNS